MTAVNVESALAMSYRISRHSVLVGSAGAGLMAPVIAAAAGRDRIVNPLVPQRADPQIFRHTDGLYYMMASVPDTAWAC